MGIGEGVDQDTEALIAKMMQEEWDAQEAAKLQEELSKGTGGMN